MRSSNLVTLITLGLLAGFAAAGCKKAPARTTPLPNQMTARVGDGAGSGLDSGLPSRLGPGPLGDTTSLRPNPDGTLSASTRDITGRDQDRNKWQNQTVYFEFDRSVVRAGEAAKVDAVAREFKGCDPESDLLIEGHCDERGTPEYNRALGERRALALREYLVHAGVNPEHVHTISFGKDNPAVSGHDEAAWSKNRRGVFILVLPKR
jgi:peptidoglycan-associated lipoprotein